MSEERTLHLASLLAVRERVSNSSAESVESVPAGAVPDDVPGILHRADARLSEMSALSQYNGGHGEAFPGDSCADGKAARDLVFQHAESALNKVKSGVAGLSLNERCAMEAIIIADGTRPSFLLDKGKVSPEDPWIGDWSGAVAASKDGMRELARAVGRIQPTGGNASRYIGTGTLVDHAKGLVLTNYHVIHDAEHGFGIAMRRDGDRIVIEGDLEIDFLGEGGSLDKCRFKIVEVLLPAGFGEVFDGIDAVVCRIEAIDARYILPPAARLLSAAPRYAQGSMSSLALIGFPGPPVMDRTDEVDWTFVVGKLFGNTFGLKRLAPGRFLLGPGDIAEDSLGFSMSHDATTFGGASGALVAAWVDTDAPAFALHFAGATAEANYALSFATVQNALSRIGVPFG